MMDIFFRHVVKITDDPNEAENYPRMILITVGENEIGAKYGEKLNTKILKFKDVSPNTSIGTIVGWIANQKMKTVEQQKQQTQSEASTEIVGEEREYLLNAKAEGEQQQN
jgi:hypothetical protein